MMEKLSNREIRKRLQDTFKNTSSIGAVSTADSSIGREVSDRTDLLMEEAREQIRKKEYQLVKKTHFEGKTILSISHLYAGYEKGKDVLSNLSVEVKEGEIFAVVGANGSGKSTLLSCMAKQMKFDGKLKCKKRIVYMPQDPTLLFVKDQLYEDLLEMGKEKEVRIDKLLEMADLMRKRTHIHMI